jgi:DNA polymerase-3 subunit epsilon
MREWLRVPAHASLPPWARERLASAVRERVAALEGTPLDSVVFGIVDLETTGVSTAHSQILEIGLVVQRAGRTLDRLSTLVDTGVVVPRVITALTGIAQADLEGAPDLESALALLEASLAAHGVTQLVAHNAPFDRRFLARAWDGAPRALPLPGFLCSLRLARRLVSSPSYGLDVLAERLAIPVSARHRALGDAEVTAVLWRELLLRARLHGVHTLEALAELARPRRGRPRRPRRRVVDAAAAIG